MREAKEDSKIFKYSTSIIRVGLEIYRESTQKPRFINFVAETPRRK